MSVMQPPKFLAVVLCALGLLSLVGSVASAQPSQDQPATAGGPIDIVEVEGLIDPSMARFITDRLAAADGDGAQLVVIRLNSPADVGIDRDALVGALEAADVPVVAWVAPRGAVAEGVAGAIFREADARFAVDEAAALAD